ncbi:ABC-2 family transporter protein (macronuclear) [Tetrahymena thermophila SB210]|uniref:ABC-2 family transporter protein n=1 Tax=Tetrahymena thermophila (strain SB210) TaxID=312017 RepID=Q22MP5_TETTS|nr:ABC-2 family transporter protein [Tetrahymena thermophila SB210]EAR86576.2 ABC-2 family transporter protein [Tetrahymena thermophila SB210]|eukprot:XP_976975.2 ABC-2 family transporter protein [Tetrahymena thermophila SB210]
MSDQGSPNSIKISPKQTGECEKIDIVFKDIDYTVIKKKNQQHILRGVSGICKNSQVNAILGSSGAGKTTLLNILCQRVQNSSTQVLKGDILANNIAYSADQFTQFASYVMQDDILLEALTVKECFQFAANLKTTGTAEQKSKKVEEITKMLKLEKCQNTFIGGNFVKGISGGEKKRTSIGYELISNPQCIFLDEPTSGLDSFTAYCIIDLLRRYAHNQNKTVVFTIHQPSSDIWNMLDHVMLMVEGQFIYQGPGGMNVVNYFSSIGFKCPIHSNPADYLMSIMSNGNEINQKNYSLYYQEYSNNLKPVIMREIQQSQQGNLPAKQLGTSYFYQIAQITLRQTKILKRNPILFIARLIQSILISLLMGAIYWQIPGPLDNPTQRNINDKNGFMFFWVYGNFMMALLPCVLTFPQEKQTYLREENSKLYSVGPYFIGKYIVDILPSAFFPALSSIIVYWMIGLNTDNPGKVLFLIFVCAIQGITGLGLGYLCGCIFQNAQVSIAVTPMLLIPFMLFGGYYKNQGDYASWIGWIQYLSPFKYSFSAVAQNEYSYEGQGYPQNPIHQLNFDLSMWESVGCLIVLSFAYTIVAFVLLSLLKQKVQ